MSTWPDLITSIIGVILTFLLAWLFFAGWNAITPGSWFHPQYWEWVVGLVMLGLGPWFVARIRTP
jgi:hypothetical protein